MLTGIIHLKEVKEHKMMKKTREKTKTNFDVNTQRVEKVKF